MIIQLQNDIAAWQLTNFGDRNPRYALMGLIEESGELSHAVLKAVQRIRGSLNDHIVEMQDALGDIFIYLVDFMRRSTIGCLYFKEEHFPKIPMDNRSEIWLSELEKASVDVSRAVNKLANAFDPYFYFEFLPWAEMHGQFRQLCLDILIAMVHFCRTASFDLLHECIIPTWENIVSKRDWKKNPTFGVEKV